MKSLQEADVTKLMKVRAVKDLFKVLKGVGLSSFYKNLVPSSLLLAPFPKMTAFD